MDTLLQASLSGLAQVFTWPTFPLMMLGILIGFIIGILPGISAPTTLALMLPFTFHMKPVEAFAFLLGMLSVSVMFGDITSILFGVPGERLAAAVVLDGHPMAKNGETGRALGAALTSSLVGALGLMLSMVGLDQQSGIQRYTFGRLELWDGIGLVPVTVGLFGIGELV